MQPTRADGSGSNGLDGYGIRRWELGKVVHVQRSATTASDLAIQAAIAFLIGSAALFAMASLYDTQVSPVAAWWKWLCGLIGGIVSGVGWFRWSSRGSDAIELEWDSRRCRVRRGGATSEHEFDDIGEVALCGEYAAEHEVDTPSGSRTQAATWQARVDLALKDGQLIPLIEGTVVEGTPNRPNDEVDPAEESYRELLQPCMQLADSLGVPWRWCGFAGHQA
ncbi:MAG: hypothetical protein QGG36_30035 [Pirellulaceae bacterium]|jgi:hypothetical protein|nr:hypothetical protein [Pirellulaceae bacterium]MDP7020075.1 hypothetical protein [Pirellulaceae bacterium]